MAWAILPLDLLSHQSVRIALLLDALLVKPWAYFRARWSELGSYPVADLRHQEVFALLRPALAVVEQNLLFPVVLKDEYVFKNVVVAQALREDKHEITLRVRNYLCKAFQGQRLHVHHRKQDARQRMTCERFNHDRVATEMAQVSKQVY